MGDYLMRALNFICPNTNGKFDAHAGERSSSAPQPLCRFVLCGDGIRTEYWSKKRSPRRVVLTDLSFLQLWSRTIDLVSKPHKNAKDISYL